MRALVSGRVWVIASVFFAATYGCGKSSPRGSDGEDAGQPAHGGESSAGDAGEARGGSVTGGGKGGSGGRAGASGAEAGSGGGAVAGNGAGNAGGAQAAGSAGAVGGSGMNGGGMSSGAGGQMGGAAGMGGTLSGSSGDGGAAGIPIYVPMDWVCAREHYADGVCDCGCDYEDLDCPSQSGADCQRCPSSSCSDEACSAIFPEDNSVCGTVAWTWTCSERLYRDGSQCDCGCGFLDPDCSENALSACDRCNAVGSCSGQACPGTIDPNSIDGCVQPPVPEGWTCEAYLFADGRQCDCGCGVPDLDCRSDGLESCDQCRCPGGDCLDSDATQCAPAPDGWLCAPELWEDFDCDCGCGVVDHACGWYTPAYCINCIGCTGGDCELLDPDDNSQCPP